MCMFSTPKAPPPLQMPQAPPAAPAAAPQASDTTVQDATQKQKSQKMKAAAANNTLVTGGAGLTAPAQTGGKQLFGQ